MESFLPFTPADRADVVELLQLTDLTLSGLDAATIRLWLLRDEAGRIRATTGYELSTDGRHALVRSVAVHPGQRGKGLGLRLGQFALDQAGAAGAREAWLFSRRSGAFWQRLGFAPADRDRLATVLATTHQVRLFEHTGQLAREMAWRRPLEAYAAVPAELPGRRT